MNMKKLKLRCSGCGKPFKTPQALGNHRNYCRRLKEGPAPTVQPAAPRVVPTPSAEKVSRGKWDPNWSDAEKERHLLESSAFEWGIGRDRHGRWRAVPIPGTGMTYSEALIRADERDSLARLFPVRRRVREEVEDEEELVKVMLMLELMSHRV
ncbi:hypothetical protein ES703_84669 [subsurface metagenome]